MPGLHPLTTAATSFAEGGIVRKIRESKPAHCRRNIPADPQ
jgi:hypothetical protein